VVDRLAKLGLVSTAADPEDRRRLTVTPTAAGTALFTSRKATALAVSDATLAPLTPEERAQLLDLLARLT